MKKYLKVEDLNEIFDSKKALKNVDYIFARSVRKIKYFYVRLTFEVSSTTFKKSHLFLV